jgi:hypothetical protein
VLLLLGLVVLQPVGLLHLPRVGCQLVLVAVLRLHLHLPRVGFLHRPAVQVLAVISS